YNGTGSLPTWNFYVPSNGMSSFLAESSSQLIQVFSDQSSVVASKDKMELINAKLTGWKPSFTYNPS
ncbi:MAG: hypothetical protein KDD15_31185, partial [Lewinella sp.]|nr:hypothetical protein [Lewinella sp.]